MKKITSIIAAITIFSMAYASDFDLSSAFKSASSNSSSISVPVPNTSPEPDSSLTSKTSISDSAAPYKWLVLVFINGANDLGLLGFAAGDVNEMETVGSTSRVAVVTEFNSLTNGSLGELQFQRGSKTLFIRRDNTPNIASEVIETPRTEDMGSYKHLINFARRNIARFQAEKVMLIVWNHGGGREGISFDDVSENHISVWQLGEAVKRISSTLGRKIDIFATDACLMQMAEVVNEVKDYADFIVGSEETIPGPGYPYDGLLNILNATNSSEQAAKSFVDAYYTSYQNNKPGYAIPNKSHTMSAIRAKKVDGFISLLNDWVDSVMANPVEFKKAADIINSESAFFYSADSGGMSSNGLRSADLYDFLSILEASFSSEPVKNKTAELKKYIKDQLVIRNKAGNGQNVQGLLYNQHSNGLAIYLPLSRYDAGNYERMSFASSSKWDDFIRAILAERGY